MRGLWCKMWFSANPKARSALNSLVYIVPHYAKNGHLHHNRLVEADRVAVPLQHGAAQIVILRA